MRLDLRYIYQRCADADMLASAPVFVRTIASASAGFCRQPSADVRRRAASHCQMSVTVKQSAYIIITWCTGTTTQGRGLSLLREMFHHEFAISCHRLQLLLQFEKKNRALLRNHDFSGACPRPRPQLNKILRPRPFTSTDAQKTCVRVRTSLAHTPLSSALVYEAKTSIGRRTLCYLETRSLGLL